MPLLLQVGLGKNPNLLFVLNQRALRSIGANRWGDGTGREKNRVQLTTPKGLIRNLADGRELAPTQAVQHYQIPEVKICNLCEHEHNYSAP